MTSEPTLRIGLLTDGEPVTETCDGTTVVSNLLIGDGFHWHRSVEASFGGIIRKLDQPQGNIRLVNELGLEQYLESVVGSEMNPSAPVEFIKAHAVISRSWALRKLRRNQAQEIARPSDGLIGWEESDSHHGFDVCSDDHCQRYQGVSERNERAVEAVSATRGLILTDRRGETADTRFAKCCGGRTEIFSSCWADHDYDYLQGFEDPWCDLSDMEPDQRRDFLAGVLKNYDAGTDFYSWSIEVNREKLRQRLQDRHHVDIGEVLNLVAESRGVSGRITRLRIEGTEGDVTIGKTLAIRRLLTADCLKSSWFDIGQSANGFTLRGRGWGHGVGLCQIGAAHMAQAGKNFAEILKFYYPNTILKAAYE